MRYLHNQLNINVAIRTNITVLNHAEFFLTFLEIFVVSFQKIIRGMLFISM